MWCEGRKLGTEPDVGTRFPPVASAHLTFWILGCMREGQGGIWLRAAVISWDSTAARALQMAMTDWITRSAFSEKSPYGGQSRGEAGPPAAKGKVNQSVPVSPVVMALPFLDAPLEPHNKKGKETAVNEGRWLPKCPLGPCCSPQLPGKHPPRCGRCQRGGSAPA